MIRLWSMIFASLAAACLTTGCADASESSAHARPSAQPAATQAALDSVLATGRFADKGGQHTSGAYRITRHGSDLRLALTDDFTTDDGPVLHLVLSPIEATAVSSGNALAGGAARIVAPLGAPSGAQQFDLPDALDLRPFQSVLVHSLDSNHLYGAAPL